MDGKDETREDSRLGQCYCSPRKTDNQEVVDMSIRAIGCHFRDYFSVGVRQCRRARRTERRERRDRRRVAPRSGRTDRSTSRHSSVPCPPSRVDALRGLPGLVQPGLSAAVLTGTGLEPVERLVAARRSARRAVAPGPRPRGWPARRRDSRPAHRDARRDPASARRPDAADRPPPPRRGGSRRRGCRRRSALAGRASER